ncbi:ferritin-like domain-containing protein [Funiculus sociatus GB2-A5]|uniref:Ferritin-like domain-containing protein n=1 Tax=Funiculus sociatus GB2-A5 TaxID=2933946 RepID=A0ABV0JU70_9CYAN|nr:MULTISPECIES: ferritin-like domain-containing protein [unclassified Trichocoleus]
MKIFSTLTAQQATENMHSKSFNLRLIRPIATAVQAVVLVSLIFLSVLIAPAAPAYAQGAVLTPRQVVEYALTLEKLEADFYVKAIASTQNGGLANAPQPAKNAIASYGQDEAQHVVDLSAVLTALGGNPDAITIPANPNYNAILGRNPFTNLADFLLAGQYVEDLGVAAYKGQVQNLLAAGEAGKTVLAGALEIHTVEARHAAGFRYLRQTLLNADIRPWIRNQNEVIYNENRTGFPIPFSGEAFDGFATSDEVLALVAPILRP